ncbi:INO80 complex subunit D [Lingula anatina]|uniref:INO80 complex subunit D n=1 Tax=Lingula anatina TaxID=7574 RepID=A0A1S3JZ32_LINAN|nr:INO80 complex subunit D [Lingula anatina]|eukprot:XP_013415665.1 INO80 complex subunit D [Lingula anatina]
MPHPLMPPQASPVGGVNMNLPPPPYPHPHSQPSPHSGGLSQPMNYPPPPYSNHSKSHILTTRLKRPRNILSEEEARKRLRTDTAMAVLAQHIQKRLFDSELLQYDVDTSEDEEDLLPRQNHWLGLSSDEEAEESVSSEDEDLGTMRLIKLSQHTSDIRRQYGQLCKAQHSNSALQDYRRTFAQALLQAARESPAAAVKAVLEVDGRTERRRRKRKKRVKSEVDKGLQKRSCLYKNEDRNEQCNNTALPYTNHCIKHIMYNVDQQLFDYCTAKTADNTQCCFPTFDIRHDMPLCMQHGKSADNYVPEPVPETELLKRPRKKTKPSALTRKTKKKKKVPNVRPEEVTALQEESDDGHEPGSPEHHPELDHSRDQLPPQRSGGGTKLPSGGGAPAPLAAAANDISDDLQGGLEADLEEVLSPGAIDKSFDLPLDQASKLLDDNDIHEVLNKLPDDLDLFSGKNGEFEPTTEELERALAAASGYSKDSLENMEKDLPEMTEEELTDRITDTILETENLNASFGDLSNENLNQLASLAHSISANEFKAMAQTASSTPVFTNNSMVSESQTYSHRPHGQVHAQGQGQMYPGQGHFSQIQSALSNGIYMGGQGLPQQQQPPPQQQQQHPGYIQRQYSHPSQQIYQPEGQVMVPHRTSPGHFGNGHANVSPHAVNGAVLAGDHIPPSPHQHSPLNPRSPMHAQSPLPGHMPVHAQSPMQSPLPSARPWFPQGQERPLTPGTPVSYHNGYPMGTPPYSQSVGPSPPSLKYTYASNQFQNSEFIHQEGRFPQHLNMTVNPQLIQRGFEANQGGFHPQWPGQHGQYHPRAGHGMMHTQGGS